jgi:Fic/DOC family
MLRLPFREEEQAARPSHALREPPLAESALHAPFASFGGTDAYPTLVEQAAVLLQHLAKNHPLPDANKRAAFLLTARGDARRRRRMGGRVDDAIEPVRSGLAHEEHAGRRLVSEAAGALRPPGSRSAATPD